MFYGTYGLVGVIAAVLMLLTWTLEYRAMKRQSPAARGLKILRISFLLLFALAEFVQATIAK